ncbi:NAD(P)-binding protein [Martensiomyces pterosporus]|nr:NAD(P)-binding protein [Martensiomyces pterosporus]
MNPVASHTRVAVVGTGGYAGLILKALLRSGSFTTVRAITRKLASPNVDKEMRLRELQSLGAEVVEYEDKTIDAFKAAFSGIDTVISAVSILGTADQLPMIDAAIQAGVRWFIPSEFGVAHYPSKWMPFEGPLAVKREVQEYLVRQAQPKGLAYTIVYTGLALDYLDPRVIGLKLTRRSATLVGRGGTPISFTCTSDVIRLIVDVVKRPQEMKNRTIRYAGSTSNMRELVKLVTGNDRGENVKLVSIDDAKAKFCELAEKQDTSAFQIYSRLLVEEGLAQIDRKHEPLNNDLFGLKPEHVKDTLGRLIKQAEAANALGIKRQPVKRSNTSSSVTDGIGATDTAHFSAEP